MKDERSHYALALGTLSLRENSPAKQELFHQVQTRYGDIQSLNIAWGLHISNWQDFLDKPVSIDRFTEPMRTDMATYSRSLATRYFQTVHDALRKYDPDHLYLGSCFSNYTPESVEACAEFCDVLSFNIYEPILKRAEWSFLDDLGRPVIVESSTWVPPTAECFTPALSLHPTRRQGAATFVSYVRNIIDIWMFVGCHYFQYNDEPVLGRSMDGENYGIGFVSVVDNPYVEMVEAARTVGKELYQRAR